jgi:uncharacterized protein (TIGR03000 family)
VTRVPVPLLAGWLAAAGTVAGQSPVAPIPTSLPPGAGVARPFAAPPLGFAGGFRTPANGYVLPAYGGFYTAPSLFPFTNGFYPNYAVLPGGFAGGYGVMNGPGTVVNVINNATPSAPGRTAAGVNVSGEEAATLVVALPSLGDVWLAGEKQKEAGTSFTLTSPALKPGEQHKFEVRAEWLAGGKRVRAERTVSVSAGDRQKLTLVLGDPVN